jgi:hypothetical protein
VLGTTRYVKSEIFALSFRYHCYMSEQTESVIWEGSVDKGRYVAMVMSIPNNQTRGVLKLVDLDGVERYQAEVGVSYDAPFGAGIKDVREWHKLITSWITNQS